MKLLTVNLEEELLKQNRKPSISDHEKVIISEATAIIEANGRADIDLLKEVGLTHAIENAIVINEREARKNKVIKDLDKDRIFTEEQIKGICLKYRLRFLPVSMYKGSIDPKLPQKIREFENIYPQAVEDKKNYPNIARYMICAPKEAFQLKERDKDPLMFHPLGDGLFYLIHKWGTDLSIFRMFTQGLRMRNFISNALWNFIFIFIPISGLIYYIHNANIPISIWSFFTIFVSFAFHWIKDELTFNNKFSERVWESKFKD